jgi:glycosyltransferase involved in cell wall biosynthesis
VRTLVVLPTYDEAADIAEVLRRVRAAAPAADILVVDDASPDGTADVAKAAGADVGGVEVIVRPGKGGLGSAYRTGFRHALERGYDAVVEMDSDLSHDPASLPALLDALAAGADLAVGSRYVAGGSVPHQWPANRRALSRWGNRYAAAVLHLPLADATSGFRAYRADVLADLDLDGIRADGYAFQVEMAYLFARAGRVIVEVPIVFAERRHGRSKMSLNVVAEALVLVTAWGARDLVSRRTRRPPGDG